MKKTFSIISPYLLTSALGILIALFLIKPWHPSLKIPGAYSGDGLFYSMLVKGIIDNGWYLHNDLIGMTSGLDMHDFFLADNLHFFLIKIIGFFVPNYAITMNLYYLLTFPLTAVTSLFVFRHYRISLVLSVTGSLLFTFLDYHFTRGEGHLMLAAYYMVPLMILVVLFVLSERNLLLSYNEAKKSFRLNIKNSKALGSIVICVLVGSAGAYYAFFGCALLLVAGIAASLKRAKIYPLFVAGFLVSAISFSVLLNLTPCLLYKYQNEKNKEVAHRDSQEAEIYGLKIAQMLLPTTAHRMPYLAKLKDKYNQSPLTNENDTASLGIIGSIGFLILLGWLFIDKTSDENLDNSEMMHRLGMLNISAVLFGTIGGFGSLFALLISPKIRSYNRISVYIAFFSFFALILLLEKYYQRRAKTKTAQITFYSLSILVLTFGIYDQTPVWRYSDRTTRFASLKNDYNSDEDFIKKIEASVPYNSMIFQLPYMAFPESGSVNNMADYDQFRGYLHSTELRWSYGAMKGRESDYWQRRVAGLPLRGFLDAISGAGFVGIYIDRYGYSDMGSDIETQLSHLFRTNPLVSANGRLVFFDLRHYSKSEPDDRASSKESIHFDWARVDRSEYAGFVDIIEADTAPAKITAGHYIRAAGWAVDPKGNRRVERIILLSNRKPFLVIPVNRRRDDVAIAFHNPDLTITGWDTTFPTNKLVSGKNRIEFYAALPGGSFVPLHDGKGGTFFDITLY